MLSSLNLIVKTQPYFLSSIDIYVDKKTFLKIWLTGNRGFKLNHLSWKRVLGFLSARQ